MTSGYSISLEILREEPVSYIYALRGPLHSNSFFIISLRLGLKTGMKNEIFWSEIGSGLGEPCGTPPPRIPWSTPLPLGIERDIPSWAFYWLHCLLQANRQGDKTFLLFSWRSLLGLSLSVSTRKHITHKKDNVYLWLYSVYSWGKQL